MATEEIKIAGLRLKLNGENEFQESLRKSSAAVSDAQGQLRLYNERQKLSEQTVGTLTEKQRLLTARYDEQAKKLKTVNDIYEETVQQKGADSREAQKLHRELQNGEIQLQKYANELTLVNRELEKKQNKLLTAGKTMTDFGDKATNAGQKLNKFGSDMSRYVTAPLLALGGVATKSAIDFESAMTGVRKTTDLTEPEFAAMTQAIRDMAKETPISAKNLAALTESAGQLGIKKENLLDFTRVMSDLGVATNIVGQEGASNFARFANITGMSQKDFDRLGSSIVELGNNSATTESEILDMAMRLAGAATQANMSEADILGVSAALSSLGLESQAGGSAFSRVINEIQLAVDTGSDDLNGFADVAGMSAGQFANAWRDDAAGALSLFIMGLGNTERQGKSTNQMLDDLGITELRLGDALRRTSGANELFTDSIHMSNDAWETNNALTKESDLFKGTAASQLEISKNKMNDVAITLGNQLIPHVTSLAEWVSELVSGFNKLSPEMQESLIKFAGIAALVGPLAKLFGGVTTAVGGLSTGIGKLVTGLGGGGGLLGTLAGPLGVIALAGLAGLAIHATGEYAKSTEGKIANFNKEMSKSRQELYDNTKATRNQATEALALVDRIEELNEIENLSTKQKLELKGAVEALNAWYPDLGLTIDEYTGKVNESTDAIKENIKQELARSLAKDYTDTYLANAKKRQDAVDAVKQAEEELAAKIEENKEHEGSQSRYDFVMFGPDSTIGLEKNLADAKTALANFDRTQDELLRNIGNASQEAARIVDKSGKEMVDSAAETATGMAIEGRNQYEAWSRAQNETAISTRKHATTMNDLGRQQIADEAALRREQENGLKEHNAAVENWRKIREELETDHAKTLKDAESIRETEREAHWNKLFSIERRGIADQGVTLAEATKNLQDQIAAYRNWQTNIQLLAEKVPPSVLAELEKLGPAQSLLIEQLVNATPEELAAFINAWRESGYLASEAAEEEMGEIPGNTKYIAELAVESVLSEKQNMRNAGYQIGMAANNGVRDAIPLATTKRIGIDLIYGIQQGMVDRSPYLYQRASAIMTNTLNTLRSIPQIKSPSRVTAEMGRNLIEGMILGMRDKERDAELAAADMMKSTLGAMQVDSVDMPDLTLPQVSLAPELYHALESMKQTQSAPTPISVTVNVDSVRSEQDIDAISNAVQKSLYNAEQRARRSLSNVWA